MTPDESRGIPDDVVFVGVSPDEHVCWKCMDQGAVIWARTDRAMRSALLPVSRHDGWIATVKACADIIGDGSALNHGVDTCPECGRGGEVGRL